MRPGSSEFVVPVYRSNVRGGTSGRSPLDLVIPDPLLRGSSAWEMALSGEEVRGSGWPGRDVLDVLAGRVNRYYSLKGDAEDELDAIRANVEALSERNAILCEENGELRRSSVVDPLVKRRRGNDGIGRGRGFRHVMGSGAVSAAHDGFGLEQERGEHRYGDSLEPWIAFNWCRG